MLLRPRLAAVVHGRWGRRLTGIIAGPGFGKSTLVAQAVAENRIDPSGRDLWLRCGPQDTDATVLGRALCAGLDAPEPKDAGAMALADEIVAAIAVHAPTSICLVLDDLHEIAAGSSGAELVELLVDALPTNGHLVLSGRRSLPVPLARLCAQGDAVRLVEADLAFTPDEVRAFAELRGVDEAMLATAGRWPAIAELAASMGGDVVQEYLWEEVLEAIDASRQRQLATLAVIGGGDDETLSAALGADVIVAEVIGDLPLATTAEAGWVELNELWHDALSAVLGPTERQDACRAAAGVRRRRGDTLGAFRLLAEARAWADALDIAREICSGAFSTVPPDTLAHWHEVLAAATPDAPEVHLLEGVVARERERPVDRARAPLERALAEFRARGDVSGEVACLSHLFGVGIAGNDLALVGECSGAAIALVDAGHQEAAVGAAFARAGLANVMDDHEAALRALEPLEGAALSEEWSATRDWFRADQLVALGRPAAALDVLNRCNYRRRDAVSDLLLSVRWHAQWFAGNVDVLLPDLDTVCRQVEQTRGARAVQGTLSSAAMMAAYAGDPDRALRHLATAERVGEGNRVPMRMARLATARAATLVASDDEEGARAALLAVCGEDATPDVPTRRVLRLTVALPYVLVPELRAALDADHLGPAFAATRTLSAALVRVRDHDDLEAVRALPTLAPQVVRPALPVPWAAHLAVAGAAVGRPDAGELLASLGPSARPWIERLAESRHRKTKTTARGLVAALPAAPRHHVEARFLGPAELRFDQTRAAPPDWRRERVRQLLAWLVLHPSTTRQATAEALWPVLALDAADNNLRITLSYLLRALQPDRHAREVSYFVRQDDGRLTLAGRDHLDVDVWSFEAELRAAAEADRAGEHSVALGRYEAALRIWRGPFLRDSPGAWADDERERLRVAFVGAASRVAALALAAGRPDDAEAHALRVLDAEPWSEAGYRIVAAAHLDRGDRTAARRMLARGFAMLDDLGVPPDDDTQMLARRLRSVPENGSR